MVEKNILKNIPNGWEIRKIKDILDFERPDNYIVKDDHYSSTAKVPVLTANKSFILGYTDEKFGIYESLPVIIFDDFTTDSKFVNFPFKIKSSAIKILKLKNSNADLKYVYEVMKSINFPIANHKRHYISQYQEQDIVVPLIQEQKKIAQILSTVDKRIQKTEEIIFQNSKLKQALLANIFSNSNKKKINFSELVNLGKNKINPNEIQNKKYVGMEHIEQETARLLGFGKSSDTASIKSSFKKGDILFGKLRPYLRKYWKAEFDGVCSTEILVFQPKLAEDTNFIFQVVQSEKFISYSNSKSFGTKMPRTDWKIISDFKVPDFSREEKTKIGEILSELDRKNLLNRKLREKFIELKKGLVQNLLSGKVRVI